MEVGRCGDHLAVEFFFWGGAYTVSYLLPICFITFDTSPLFTKIFIQDASTCIISVAAIFFSTLLVLLVLFILF